MGYQRRTNRTPQNRRNCSFASATCSTLRITRGIRLTSHCSFQRSGTQTRSKLSEKQCELLSMQPTTSFTIPSMQWTKRRWRKMRMFQQQKRRLMMVQNYPRDQPYISLFLRKERDTDEVKAKREAMRATIDAAHNKLHHSKHAVDEEEVEEDADVPAAEEEADDGADDFFLAVADDAEEEAVEEDTPKKKKKKKKAQDDDEEA